MMKQLEAPADRGACVEKLEELVLPRGVERSIEAEVEEFQTSAAGATTARQWWFGMKASIAAAFRADSDRLYPDHEVDQAKLAAKVAEQVALARVMEPPFGSTPGPWTAAGR